MADAFRFAVNDAVLAKVAPLLPGKASDRGMTAADDPLFPEAVLWRVRTGPPWRDLHASSTTGPAFSNAFADG